MTNAAFDVDVMAGVFRAFCLWSDNLPSYQKNELHFEPSIRDRVCNALVAASKAGVRDYSDLTEVAAKAAGWSMPAHLDSLARAIRLPRERVRTSQQVNHDTLVATM